MSCILPRSAFEADSFVACLTHLTIDPASLSGRSTVPTPNREHVQHLGAHYVFGTHYIKPVLHASYPLPASAVCAHNLSPRIAIVFSLLSSVLIFSLHRYNIRLFSSSPTHPVPRCTFHVLPQCELCSLLLCHKGTSVHLSPPPPPPDYWHTPFFFLAGPGPLHETRLFRVFA